MAKPPLDPRVVRRVLDLFSAGMPRREVLRVAGVSRASVDRIRASVGGVFRPPNTTYSERYLDREERYELARLLEAGHSQAGIARLMKRNPSTISRELQRNRCPRTGRYVPEVADRLAWQRQRRPKRTRLGQHPRLRAAVQQMLDQRYSPEQVAGRLRRLYPDNPCMWVSHEAIYRGIYVHARGQLQRELKAHLRTRRTQRRHRGRQSRVERREGWLSGAVSIHDRPPEVEGRLVPGHHEGDLIIGSTASVSAIGTIVERTSGYLNLVHLPDGHTADLVAAAVSAQLQTMPAWFVKTLTWDRGREMARHAKITEATGVQVYFADPYSPHQRGSNENINGLLREYFPKSTDLSVHSRADLQTVADQLNDRPRKRLDFATPREAFASLLTQDLAGVARTE
ncbi:MAG: IS30 family transposase [Actinomycetes bacterium]